MIAVSILSGGKDSNYALYLAEKEYGEVEYILTLKPKKYSYAFHIPNVDFVSLQVKAMGKKHIMKQVSGEKNKELNEFKNILKKLKKEYGIEYVISGVIKSNYQKKALDNICKDLGLKHISPLWQRDEEELWKEMLKLKFDIIITSVATYGLDTSWLGKRIGYDEFKTISYLSKKHGFNLSFEGGEAETFVLYMPLYKKRIKILKAETVIESEQCGFYIIKDATLVSLI